MGQLQLTPLKNTDVATPELFDEKFAAIAQILNKGIDADNIKDGSITAALLSNEMLNKTYPVGSIYRNGLVDTNPAVLLGIGTWEPWAVGRTTVSFDAAQTEFNAVGKTGGAKTVSLTAAQNGPHSHGVSDPGHSHSEQSGTRYVKPIHGSGDWSHGFMDGPTGSSTGVSGTGISIHNSGNGEAHENMPPFKVAYEWIRTQ